MSLPADIYRTATLLVTEYGELATAGAFIKADQLRDLGDIKGREMWLRIAKATQDLLSDSRPDGSTVH